MSVRELIARIGQEREIEELLFAYPYLVDPTLENPRRQVVLNNRLRLDLLFDLTDGKKVVVELKRGKIGAAEVNQLQNYRKELGLRKTRGILVGSILTPEGEKRIQNLGSAISFRQIGRDVPIRIRVCLRCRRARSAAFDLCESDGTSETI